MLGLVALSSCSSWRRITTKDGSAPKKKVTRNKRDIKFIDGIEVTPGSVVTSKHRSASTRQSKKNQYSAFNNPDPDIAPGNIERVNLIQLKYAIIMDATVERLPNIYLLQAIDEWWGTRYCMGGSSKNCIDCSAFTQEVMRSVYGVQLPRTAQEQYDASQKVDLQDLKQGDLVFFHSGRRGGISHVGVYIANNKFVHASTSGGVTISDLNDNYWRAKFKGGGRVLLTALSQ